MRIQFVRLSATLLAFYSRTISAAPPTSSNTLACNNSVALSSHSSTKWVVSCITNDTITVSSASFDPSLVQDYYVDDGIYVTASMSNMNLSSTFSNVHALVSPSITSFSLSAASGFKPTIPVSIASTAFANLSALETLHLESIPLADSNLHLLLPSSIQQISIIDCGLSNISITFEDGFVIGDSALSFIDLRHNHFKNVPTSLYALPSTVSSIDLRGNDQLNLVVETSAHTKQLAAWINDQVLKAESVALSTFGLFSQEKHEPDVGPTRTKAHIALPASLSGTDDSVTATQIDSDESALPVTIVAIAVFAMLVVAFVLACVKRKRRRMQDRETDAILGLPHPFGKISRDSLETSGDFTTADSDLSRSRLSSGDNHYFDAHDRNSCVMLDVTHADANVESTHPIKIASTSACYVHVNSSINISIAHSKKAASSRKDGTSNHLQELFSAKSSAITTPAQKRLVTRKQHRLTLKALLEAKLSVSSIAFPSLLTINGYEYSFTSGTRVKETPLAFFIDCQLNSCGGSRTSMLVSSSKLLLKIFIEDDAELAEQESYALSCLQYDDSTRAFAPCIHDTALKYELVSESSMMVPNIVTINCCILVLEMPSYITLSSYVATARMPSSQQISHVVTAVRALHSRKLVHGALHTDSFVAYSPGGRLKLWGLEHASKSGHSIPFTDVDTFGVCQAEYVAPEYALFALKNANSCRTSPALDVWSLGVIILKMYVLDRQLEEFQGCTTRHDVFRRLNASGIDREVASPCFFERSIAQFVQNDDVKDILHQCFQRCWTSRPSVDSILNHAFFQPNKCEVSRLLTMANSTGPHMHSVMTNRKGLVTSCTSNDIPSSGEPERQTSGRDQGSYRIENDVHELVDVALESLPPSLCLFLAPVELALDSTKRTSFYSVEQWVSKLQHLQQQRAEELRFPLIFMCESYESNFAVPCTVGTTPKFGVSVTASLLPLVMPLVRETMLFLEARAIVSSGSSIEKTGGLAGPHPWHELRTFYRALEHMELATVNPVTEVELGPMEQQLNAQDPAKAQEVLEKLTRLIFNEDKRKYIRNLLDAFVSEEGLVSRSERSSWATLYRCNLTYETSSTLSRTRWLCSHHARCHS